MKTLREKLIELSTDHTGRNDGTEFEGRYFITDTELDKLAIEYNLADVENFYISELIEKIADCKLTQDYPGANPNQQFGEQEIIFNNQCKADED